MDEEYINSFLLLASAISLALLSPGPDFAITVRQSINYGKKYAIISSLGIGAGICVHVAYTVFGLGLIITQTPIIFNSIKYLGAGYLIYLGFQSLGSKGMSIQEKESVRKPMTSMKSFKIGFFTNLLNPKATLFFLSIFTLVVDMTTPTYILIIFGIFCILINFFWYSFLALILVQNKVLNFFKLYSYIFDRTIGVVLIILGISLVF
jgi:RhtB (resistance to homoserine/threonine) family protein